MCERGVMNLGVVPRGDNRTLPSQRAPLPLWRITGGVPWVLPPNPPRQPNSDGDVSTHIPRLRVEAKLSSCRKYQVANSTDELIIHGLVLQCSSQLIKLDFRRLATLGEWLVNCKLDCIWNTITHAQKFFLCGKHNTQAELDAPDRPLLEPYARFHPNEQMQGWGFRAEDSSRTIDFSNAAFLLKVQQYVKRMTKSSVQLIGMGACLNQVQLTQELTAHTISLDFPKHFSPHTPLSRFMDHFKTRLDEEKIAHQTPNKQLCQWGILVFQAHLNSGGANQLSPVTRGLWVNTV